jgi:hypothetical protein
VPRLAGKPVFHQKPWFLSKMAGRLPFYRGRLASPAGRLVSLVGRLAEYPGRLINDLPDLSFDQGRFIEFPIEMLPSRQSRACGGIVVTGWSWGLNIAKPVPGNKIAGNHFESE